MLLALRTVTERKEAARGRSGGEGRDTLSSGDRLRKLHLLVRPRVVLLARIALLVRRGPLVRPSVALLLFRRREWEVPWRGREGGPGVVAEPVEVACELYRRSSARKGRTRLKAGLVAVGARAAARSISRSSFGRSRPRESRRRSRCARRRCPQSSSS